MILLSGNTAPFIALGKLARISLLKRLSLLCSRQSAAIHPPWLTLLVLLLLVPLRVGAVAEEQPAADGAAVVAVATTTATQYLSQGLAAYRSGDFERALGLCQEAEHAAAQGDERTDQVLALMRQGHAYRALGRLQRTIRVLEAALAVVLRGSGDMPYRAAIRAALGETYGHTGAKEKAQQHLQAAASMAREEGNNGVAIVALNGLGNLLSRNDDLDGALAAYGEGAELAEQTKERLLLAKTEVNAARVLLEAGQATSSGRWLERALATVTGVADSHDKAFILLNAGRLAERLHGEQGDADGAWLRRAHSAYRDAETLARSIGDNRAASFAWGFLGRLYENRQRHDEAMQLTARAIFAAQQADAPEIIYRWQWQTGRLLEVRGDQHGALAAYRDAVASLLAVRSDFAFYYGGDLPSFRQTAEPLYSRLADLLLRNAANTTDREELQGYLVEARAAIEQLKAAELQDFFQDDCVTEFQAKSTGLDTIAEHTAVLYPILLNDRTELLLSLAGGIKQVVVPVGRAAITREVRLLRRGLENRISLKYLAHARKLYGWLIEPVAAELEEHSVETLVVVPDGPLRTIPMAALYDGKQYLISRYAIGTTPGLTLTDPLPLEKQRLKLLLNGLTESVQGFSGLPNVGEELDKIASLYTSQVFKDKEYLLATVERELTETPYSIVHIASHGQFKGDPKESFLLTYDARMTMDHLQQFMGLSKYRDTPVELLTLSACQTAAGDDRAALGLAGIAVKAGARSALATLWFISDEASSALVAEFYRQLQRPELSKAKALQQAQLKLIADKRYRHPGYWAPFLLIGNWL